MFVNDIPVAQQIKLLQLPPPEIIKTQEFEVIYESLWAQFVALEPNYRYRLESDPVAKVIQAWAYERMLIESRINFAARQCLLTFAEGAVLDHLGANYGVERMVITPTNVGVIPPTLAVMESDERLRDRIQLAIAGHARRGGREYYRYHAMTADPRVLDAFVFSPDHLNGYNMGGQVMVCILSSEDGFLASQDLINTVDANLKSDTVKALNDVLVVEGAVPKIVDFNLKVKMRRLAQKSVFDSLEATFREAFLLKQTLGTDITQSWIHDTLYTEGIHSIEIISPTADSQIQFNEFPVLGILNIEFAGYSDSDGYNIAEVEKSRAMRVVYETYKQHCIETRATIHAIISDLTLQTRTGIVEPTIIGFAQYLGLVTTRNGEEILPEEEIAFLIHNKLSPLYVQ